MLEITICVDSSHNTASLTKDQLIKLFEKLKTVFKAKDKVITYDMYNKNEHIETNRLDKNYYYISIWKKTPLFLQKEFEVHIKDLSKKDFAEYTDEFLDQLKTLCILNPKAIRKYIKLLGKTSFKFTPIRRILKNGFTN